MSELIRKVSALLCILLVSCAQPQEQATSPRNHSVSLNQDYLQASDGAHIPVSIWKPEGTPRAVVIALHGMNDYSHAYAMMAKDFTANHIMVIAYDQRGFGKAPMVGIWPGEENLVHDLQDMVHAVQQQFPAIPLYVMGESMGASVVADAFTRKDAPKVDGLILSAPALWGGDALNPFYSATLWALCHVMPDKKLTGQGLRIVATDNIEVLKEMWKDPLVLKGARADAVLGLVRLMGIGHDRIKELRQPTLLLYGKRDQVIPADAVASALTHIPENIRVGYYPNGYHLLLRDHGRAEPYNDIFAWMAGDKTGNLPSGRDKDARAWLAAAGRAHLPSKQAQRKMAIYH